MKNCQAIKISISMKQIYRPFTLRPTCISVCICSVNCSLYISTKSVSNKNCTAEWGTHFMLWL